MIRKSGLGIALLYAGLMVCMAGCGSVNDNPAAGEDIRSDGSIIASDSAGAADETVDGEITSAEENSYSAKSEQADADDSEYGDTWEGRSLSILGDSISTYDGYIPEGCAVYYPASGMLTDVSQTWWMRLLDDTGMELCSNNSSSGSTCVGDSLDVGDPKYGCSSSRISQLTGRQGTSPDLIIVYMGTNDLLIGFPVGDNDGTRLVEEGVIENFSDAYTLILDKLESDYPAAQVYCCTLAQVGTWGTKQPFEMYTNKLELTAEDYSKQIQVIADNKGIPVIDLYHCGIEIDNLHEMTSDGVHLTPDGMECVEHAMLEAMGFAQE